MVLVFIFVQFIIVKVYSEKRIYFFGGIDYKSYETIEDFEKSYYAKKMYLNLKK